jgi:hypothetical protein
MVRICCSAASFSPGTAWRLATTPLMGATSAAWRMVTWLVSSWALAAFQLARADS